MSKPAAIIVDIDGTVADKGDRNPYDYTKVSEDKVIEPIRALVNIFDNQDFYVLVVSGRSDECELETRHWLARNDVWCDRLFMRFSGDHRPDEEVKRDIYEWNIEPDYDVKYVLDDRDKVVKMWRELGLTVLQVAEGDF